MSYFTPQEYANGVDGRWIDVDGVYGAQCVDLWKDFIGKIGYPNPARAIGGTGYAKEIWLRRYELGYMDFFEERSVSEMKDGDWIIWGNGIYTPDSHVAMFRSYTSNTSALVLGQNQGEGAGINGKAANQMSFPLANVIGVLRPKLYITHSSDSKEFGGLYTLNLVDGGILNVRNEPTITGEVVAYYQGGTGPQEINLDNWYTVADGFVWGRYTSNSGIKRYVAVGPNTGEVSEDTDFLIKR